MNFRTACIPLTLAAILMCQGAAAQFATGGSSSGSASGGSSGAFGQQTDPTDAITSFDDFEVQVRRVVRDPTQDDAFRLIMSVTDNGKSPRKVAFLQPPTVLLDEFGNVYYAIASSGIQICANSKLWDLDLTNCHRYQAADTTRLSTGVPTNVVLTFTPAPQNFSKELAQMAAVGSIQSRIGYYSLDGKTSNYADIVINNIEIPQGGS